MKDKSLKDKCRELRDYFWSELEGNYENEFEEVVAAGQCVMNYCSLMRELGNNEYDWTAMRYMLYYKGLAENE